MPNLRNLIQFRFRKNAKQQKPSEVVAALEIGDIVRALPSGSQVDAASELTRRVEGPQVTPKGLASAQGHGRAPERAARDHLWPWAPYAATGGSPKEAGRWVYPG